MRVVVVTPPEPIITVPEVKLHCRVEQSVTDDDDLITALIDAATRHIDGPEGWLGRSIGIQTLRATFCEFGCHRAIRLRCPPVISIDSVKYLDRDGAEQTFAADQYSLVDDTIWLRSGSSWPATGDHPDAVRIQYQAGYAKLQGDPAVPVADVPPPIKAAILMHVAHLFINREAVVLADQPFVLPWGADALLSTYRTFL